MVYFLSEYLLKLKRLANVNQANYQKCKKAK